MYTAEDGLSHSVVYSTFQDSKGFIWFATDFGLTKFDGITYTNYTKQDGLPSNFITSITETDNNTLWIATYDKGIVKLQNGIFIDCPWYKKYVDDKLLQILADKENRVWFRDGKEKVGYIQNKVVTFFDINLFTKDSISRTIHNLFKKTDGSLLFATSKGAFQFKNNTVTPQISGLNSSVYAIDEDSLKNLWLVLEGKILKLFPNGKTQELNNTFFKNKRIRNFKIDNASRLWLGSYPQDILVINSETAEVIYSENIPVNDIFKDREHNIWVSTFGQGVRCFNASFITNYTIKDGLTDNIISEVAEDSTGKTWIANLRGINYIAAKTENVKQFITEEEDHQIYALTKDYDGNIMYALIHSLVIIKNRTTKKIPIENRIYSLYKDREKRVWISTNKGVLYYENNNIINPKNLSELSNKKIACIFQDHNNTFWFGTSSGLFQYKNNKLKQITDKDAPNNSINDICEDLNKKIWFATDAGVYSLYENNWHFYSSTTYMNGSTCLKIISDDHKNHWIGTNKGLYIFNDTLFRKLNHRTGLIGSEIKSLFIDSKKILWVGTIKGLSKINLTDYFKEVDSNSFPIYIKNVKINGTTLNLPQTESLSLKHDENNVSINFVALFYKNPVEIFYEYKLVGASDTWQKTENRSVEFSALAPGNYTFLVKAVNSCGNYSQSTASFSFSIAAPFWAKPWFIAFLIALFIIVVIIIYKWQIKIYKQKALEKLAIHKQLINLEHRALSALMNPHFIFNVLNSIQYYMKYVNMNQAHEYLQKFTKLIRLNFENAKRNYNTLENEITALELFCSLEQLRFEHKFVFQVKVSSEINLANTYVPSILIQPFVENAIWHGLMHKKEAGKVIVAIDNNNNELVIKITDDGVGIGTLKTNKKTHHSSAIELTKQRLAILEKLTGHQTSIQITNLKNLNSSETGTEVEINLPILNQIDISKHID